MVNRQLGNSYSTGDWKDLLVSFNGNPIAYEGQDLNAVTNVLGQVTYIKLTAFIVGSHWMKM